MAKPNASPAPVDVKAGKNVHIRVVGDHLTILIDLGERFGPSKSGRTEVVATTGGNLDIPGHPGMKLGLNVYTK